MAPIPALPDAEASSGLATKADIVDINARTAVLEARLTDLKDSVDAIRHSVDTLRQELKEDARGAWKQFFAARTRCER